MPEYLSLPECSRRYHLSEKTLHNWIGSGLLQADKVRVMEYISRYSSEARPLRAIP